MTQETPLTSRFLLLLSYPPAQVDDRADIFRSEAKET